MIEPLRLTLVVACAADHAFETWTGRTSSWWPARHTMSGEAGLEVIFEPRVGGRLFERTPSGREIEWGRITVWEPPRRVGYTWHMAADQADATDVEIAFVAVSGSSTRVDIEHRGWERLGAERGPAWRDRNRGGWAGLLPAFAGALEGATG